MKNLYNVFIVFTNGSTYNSTQPMYVGLYEGELLEIYFEGDCDVFPWKNIQRVEFKTVKLH